MTVKGENVKGPVCGFCGQWHTEVKRLIQGPITGVCDECVTLMVDMIREDDEGFCLPPDIKGPSGVFSEDIFSRMHLTQSQVEELLPVLERFVKTGTIS